MNIEDISDPLVRAKLVALPNGCWFWRGALNTNGYGHFVRRSNGRQKKTYVHRHVYATLVGPIPARHEIHHSCYNRWCSNPEHLSAVTHADNCEALNK